MSKPNGEKSTTDFKLLKPNSHFLFHFIPSLKSKPKKLKSIIAMHHTTVCFKAHSSCLFHDTKVFILVNENELSIVVCLCGYAPKMRRYIVHVAIRSSLGGRRKNLVTCSYLRSILLQLCNIL